MADDIKCSVLGLYGGQDHLIPNRLVEKMNLKVLVVDKNGNFFEKEKWFLSKTFRSYQQKNLMISDNQTIKFELTSFENKLKDTENTWGRLDIYNTRDK